VPSRRTGLPLPRSQHDEPEHHTITVGGRVVEFHLYVEDADARQHIAQLTPYFARMPASHLAVLYPIFVMKKKPGGALGGGTWLASQVRSEFMGTRHAQNTGVPDSDVERLVISAQSGMLGLSRDRWERPIGLRRFTVFHEVGHCVDAALGLVPSGATEADFAGMDTNRCGAGNFMVRRAVELYARYICGSDRLYHTLPRSESQVQANRRLLDTLRRMPAFRCVSVLPPIGPG
jgi:hypothetical protein